MARVAARPKPEFCASHGLGAVVENHGSWKRACQELKQWDLVPAEAGRVDVLLAVVHNHARYAYPNAKQVTTRSACFLDQLVDALSDERDQRPRRLARQSDWFFDCGQLVQVQVEELDGRAGRPPAYSHASC